MVTALKSQDKPAHLASRRHGIGFWLAAYVFAITIAFSTVPAPLYVLYQARDHFGSLLVTIIFAVYALGVAASLFLAGHVSDWLGRRRILLIAVATNMVAGLLFLFWPTVPRLIIGRIVSGFSIGMLTATATATAYLSELHAVARPQAPRTRAEIVAAASLGGLGLGPLVAGLLPQYADAPLVLPYLVFEVLMLAGCVALAFTPETVVPAEPRRQYRPQRIAVPAASRAMFFAASIATAVGFAQPDPGDGGGLEPEPGPAADRRRAGRRWGRRGVQGRHLHHARRCARERQG
jgi:MFS family permease